MQHSGETCRVAEGTILGMFRELNSDEVADFRAWADEQPEGTKVDSNWHPVSQDQLFITGKGVE